MLLQLKPEGQGYAASLSFDGWKIKNRFRCGKTSLMQPRRVVVSGACRAVAARRNHRRTGTLSSDWIREKLSGAQ